MAREGPYRSSSAPRSKLPLAPSATLSRGSSKRGLLGVAFFGLRSAGGFLLLERERRQQSTVVEDQVLEICYDAAGSARRQSRHSVLRVQVAAGAGCDRMVSPDRISARDRADRSL